MPQSKGLTWKCLSGKGLAYEILGFGCQRESQDGIGAASGDALGTGALWACPNQSLLSRILGCLSVMVITVCDEM
jgi:hypothetical protein